MAQRRKSGEHRPRPRPRPHGLERCGVSAQGELSLPRQSKASFVEATVCKPNANVIAAKIIFERAAYPCNYSAFPRPTHGALNEGPANSFRKGPMVNILGPYLWAMCSLL